MNHICETDEGEWRPCPARLCEGARLLTEGHAHYVKQVQRAHEAEAERDRLREQNAAQAEQLRELREALGAILNEGRPIPWARCAAIADAALSRIGAVW